MGLWPYLLYCPTDGSEVWRSLLATSWCAALALFSFLASWDRGSFSLPFSVRCRLGGGSFLISLSPSLLEGVLREQ